MRVGIARNHFVFGARIVPIVEGVHALCLRRALRSGASDRLIVIHFQMNKKTLVEKIIAQLVEEAESYARSARASQAEATDEQSKAENKYDTRGLEASYLAHGQSRHAAEVEEAIELFRSLPLREFGVKDAIDLGALAEVERQGRTARYFIGPRAGGMEISHAGKTVLVITPQSPLGRQLVGAKAGQRLAIDIGGAPDDCRVLAVS